jgi:GNAT superfamily N-acetyltransferase
MASSTLLADRSPCSLHDTGVVLRPETPDDEPFARRLFRSTREDLTGIPGLDHEQREALVEFQFRAQRAGYDCTFPDAARDLVVLDGTEIGRLYVNRSAGIHRLVDIALLPERRGHGIGRQLILGLQERAAREHAVVRLHVRSDNPARALYRRMGFLPLPPSAADGSVGAAESDSWATGPGDPGPPDVELEWCAEHWLPIHLVARDGTPWVEWFDASSSRLREPFFVEAYQDAERRHRADPDRRWVRRGSLAQLLDEAERAPGLAPSGFVLHMSRCGSTLLSQMLATDRENLVLSEPPALDQVLRNWWSRPVAEEEWLRTVRAVLSVLGRPRHGERRLFVKLDAWHTTMLPLLLRAFPGTPWVFLARDPVEVLVSQERVPSAFIVPGGAPAPAFGLDLLDAARQSHGEYAVSVLAAICRTARSCLEHGGKIIAYEDLPGALGDVLAHFDVPVDDERLAAMSAASLWNAKFPTQPFLPDGPAKRADAGARLFEQSAELRAVLGTWGIRAAHEYASPVPGGR